MLRCTQNSHFRSIVVSEIAHSIDFDYINKDSYSWNHTSKLGPASHTLPVRFFRKQRWVGSRPRIQRASPSEEAL